MEELLKELKESRDKVIHQDQAAKTALQQMQKEMTYRLEQVELGLVNSNIYILHSLHSLYPCLLCLSFEVKS